MNLGKTLVQVATAPVRIGLAVADLGLGIANETLTAVQRGIGEANPLNGRSSMASLFGIDDAVERANRLARLLDDDAPLGRALAPEGPINRLLRPGGIIDQLTAEGGLMDRLTADNGAVARAVAPGGLVDQITMEGP